MLVEVIRLESHSPSARDFQVFISSTNIPLVFIREHTNTENLFYCLMKTHCTCLNDNVNIAFVFLNYICISYHFRSICFSSWSSWMAGIWCFTYSPVEDLMNIDQGTKLLTSRSTLRTLLIYNIFRAGFMELKSSQGWSSCIQEESCTGTLIIDWYNLWEKCGEL